MMEIKICGITREEDIAYVNEAMPDYIGFVFAPSRRRLTFDAARRLRAGLVPGIKAVGVFVDENPEVIAGIYNEGIIDMVQLHGHESREYIEKLNAPVIKALRTGDDIPDNADFLLFDSSGAGSGRTFDWTALPKTDKPFFIAGGINIGNIGEALGLGCRGVDVSSGAETGGFKDREKIIELVRRVRNV